MRSITHWDVSDPGRLRDSLSQLEKRLGDLIFQINLTPGDFEVSGSCTKTILSSKAFVLEFATGTDDNYAYFELPVREYWVSGDLYLEIFYSGDNTSNDYAISGQMVPTAIDESITGTAITVTDTSVSPPGTTEFLQTVTLSSFALDANDKVAAGRIQRQGVTDSNAGSLYISRVNCRFYPSRI